MAKMINKTLVLTYIYLLIYVILSSGVILYNKWVLSPKYFNFPLPITLTMIHMWFAGFVAFLLIRVFKHIQDLWYLRKILRCMVMEGSLGKIGWRNERGLSVSSFYSGSKSTEIFPHKIFDPTRGVLIAHLSN